MQLAEADVTQWHKLHHKVLVDLRVVVETESRLVVGFSKVALLIIFVSPSSANDELIRQSNIATWLSLVSYARLHFKQTTAICRLRKDGSINLFLIADHLHSYISFRDDSHLALGKVLAFSSRLQWEKSKHYREFDFIMTFKKKKQIDIFPTTFANRSRKNESSTLINIKIRNKQTHASQTVGGHAEKHSTLRRPERIKLYDKQGSEESFLCTPNFRLKKNVGKC